MDDLQLIGGLARGDKGAFEELFNKYYSSLVLFAGKMVHDNDMSRELVQEVFVNFYEKHEEIKIHTSLKAHLFQSVRNRCLNYIKRESNIRSHHALIEADLKQQESFIDTSIEEVELEQRIYATIKLLPEKCREVFEMSRFQDLSNQDIADQLSLSKRTVETQISKALRFIRDKLSDHVMIVMVYELMNWFS